MIVINTTGIQTSTVELGVFKVTANCRPAPPAGPDLQDSVSVQTIGVGGNPAGAAVVIANSAPGQGFGGGPGSQIFGAVIGFFSADPSSRFTTQLLHLGTKTGITITAARWRSGSTCQMVVNVAGAS
jgi:hypothetical protein